MSASQSHAIKHRNTAKDVFYTPDAVAKAHIASIRTEHLATDIYTPFIWLDPFKGSGAYYNNFPTDAPHNKVWCEIADGIDFFNYTFQPDVICSNPPYSMIDKVLEKSVALKPKIISYLLLHGSMTPKRIDYMKSAGYGLVGIYTCKVYKWYGMAEAYTFELGAGMDNCRIRYDRTVHRLTKEEEVRQAEAVKRLESQKTSA